uniref:UBX domain-containing protein n=1 Tax=Parascaris univalens TaxID=6257 RepID=A0A914ZMP7_PARUN
MAVDNDQQAEIISSFKEVCAVSDETAMDFLHRNDWNLEAAVQHFFQTGGQLEVEDQNISNTEQELRQRHLANEPSTSRIAASRDSSPFESRPIIPLERRIAPPMTWGEWLYSIVTLPLAFTYHSFMELLRFLWSLIRAPPLSVADPRGDVHRFVRDFDTLYGHQANQIQWCDAPYSDALNECKNSLRFMIVYLHNPSHEATDRFVRGTLLSQQMRQFVERNDILMWGASIRSQEGYKVSMALRENTYPFLGLICMREHHMAMVLRLEGEYELEPMLYSLQTAIDENRLYLNAIREEREQREANNRIRREQEVEYQRGLEADRARLDQLRRAESERQLAAKKEAETRLKQRLKKEKLREIRSRMARELPSETNSAEHVRVSVRFPSGDRFERRFDLDDSLEMLFRATFAHEKCPDDFTLLCSYPRRQLNCAPEWYREYGSSVQDPANIPTFRACGFDNSLVVLVQDNDA